MARSNARVLGARYIAGLAVLAAAYAATARIGIEIAAANQLVTAVWPPTGIAVVALVAGGRRYWPGIAIGALVAEASSGVPIGFAAGIAVGNTLAPVLAASALERWRVRHELDRVRDVLSFFLIAGASMVVSATVGTAVVRLAYGPSGRPAALTWLIWWVGDAMGVVVIVPVAFGALRLIRDRHVPRPWETTVVLAAGVVVTVGVWAVDVHIRHLILLVAIVAALRLGPTGAALMNFTIATVSVWTVAIVPGPDDYVLLQSLVAAVGLTSLTLAALTQERNASTNELRSLASGLEARVAERTTELAQANAELRKMGETKDAILGAVSHELRTPLTAILGFTELLNEPDVRRNHEVSEDLVARLSRNARRLNQQLQDLLDLSRFGNGDFEPERETLLVRELADASLRDLEIGKRPISVQYGTGACLVDPTYTRRIIQNLVTNAAKYTPPGTPIHLLLQPRPCGGLHIGVEDEGPGIPENRRSAIFEPFERVHNGTYTQGAGLGLALVARFAKVHGGRAWVDERPGGGAAFHVDLPGPSRPRDGETRPNGSGPPSRRTPSDPAGTDTGSAEA